MATHTTHRPVKLPTSEALRRVFEDETIRKDFLEESIARWEEALAVVVSEPAPRMEEMFIRLDRTLTAPQAQTSAPTPSTATTVDGFLPINNQELIDVLDTYAERIAQVPVETILDFAVAYEAPERVYTFDTPVTVARTVGWIYTRDQFGNKVPLADGVAARIIIEELPGATPGADVTRQLQGTFRDSQVVWTD